MAHMKEFDFHMKEDQFMQSFLEVPEDVPGQLGITLLNICDFLQKYPQAISDQEKVIRKTQQFWNVLSLKYFEF